MIKRLYPTIVKHDYGSLSDLLAILKAKIRKDTILVKENKLKKDKCKIIT
jgi:hypothetical protein